MRQACLTQIILLFVRHVVNDTKTNQFLFSTLLLMAIGHPWHASKLRSIFTWKVGFLDDQYLHRSHNTWFTYDFGGILHLCYHFITYNVYWFRSNTPHTQTMISDVRSVRMGHLETLSQCAPKLSQGSPSLSQGAPKVSQGAPTFLRHIFYCNI